MISLVLPLQLDPIAERNLCAKFWINWKIFRGRTALLYFFYMCNALQHTSKQRNTTLMTSLMSLMQVILKFKTEVEKGVLVAQRENETFVELVEHWQILGTSSIKAKNIKDKEMKYI